MGVKKLHSKFHRKIVLLWGYKKLNTKFHRKIVCNFRSQECLDTVCVQSDSVGNICCLKLPRLVSSSNGIQSANNNHS